MRSYGYLCAALSGVFMAAGCASTGTTALSSDVVTAEEQAAMTPDQVIADLKAGNERFVARSLTPRDYTAKVIKTSEGQYPKAVVLSCLDSRVPVEIVFDQGIGDIFVGRVAGNFENVDMLGSMEFATKLAGSKAIVVMGHTGCGAIKGAMAGAEMGNLTPTLANITPAVQDVPGAMGAADDAAMVGKVVEANVRRTVRDIRNRSQVLAEMIDAGDIKVVGAVYDLSSGKVTWLDS